MSLITENQGANTFKPGETQLAEYYQRYADAFNSLVEKIEAAKIPFEMLHELIASVEDIERLSLVYTIELVTAFLQHEIDTREE